MKKLVVAVLAVFCFAPAVMAEGWGVGVKLGGGENDPKDLQRTYDHYFGNKEIDKVAGYFSLEVLHEWSLNNEANKLGLKVGWDIYGENVLKAKSTHEELKEDTYAFPFTVYYKRDNGVKNFSWFAGAGVTIIRSKLVYKGASYWNYDTKKTKVFPHITLGTEYRFTEVFALGLDARYNFSAKVKNDSWILSDRSGFGAALTGRFYF